MIRLANIEDAPKITVLAIQVWLDTYALDGVSSDIAEFLLEEFTVKKYIKKIQLTSHRVFVKIKDDHLVGFIVLDLNSTGYESNIFGEYEVETLYVQKNSQGQGVGSELLRLVITEIGSKFWLSTWINNTTSIGFYKHFGMKQVGITYFMLGGEKHENIALSNKD
jgi:diamine N-acetyltransferase